MNLIYVILIVVVLLIIGFRIFVKRMMKEPPYFETKRILEENLSSIEETDWKGKQEVNLKLCWINSLESFELSTTLSNNKEETVREKLNNFTMNEIEFPVELDLNEYSHFNFTYQVVLDFVKVVNDSGYQSMKPYKILPYPFEFIDKSFTFLLRFLKNDREIFPEDVRLQYIDDFERISCNLSFFVDTGNDDISKDWRKSLTDSRKYKSWMNE